MLLRTAWSECKLKDSRCPLTEFPASEPEPPPTSAALSTLSRAAAVPTAKTDEVGDAISSELFLL